MSRALPEPSVRLGTLPLVKRWTPEAYDQAAERNLRVYRRGYEQDAYVDEELLFPSWPQVRNAGRGKKIADLLGERAQWFKTWGRYGGADLSGPQRPGNVFATMAASSAGEQRGKPKAPMIFCPLEVISGQWTHPVFFDHITGSFRRWRHDRINVEGNAQQDQVIQWGERIKELGGDVPWLGVVEAYTTTARKWDEHHGLPGMEVEFSRGAWMIPYGEWQDHSAGCACGWCMLDAELSQWTKVGPGSDTSDHVMAVYFAWEAARQGAVGSAYIDLQLRGY